MSKQLFNKSIETEKGPMNYRLPNLSEGFIFLSAINKIENLKDILRMKGEFALVMDTIIDWRSLGYATYDDFLMDKKNNYRAVAQIADEVYHDLADSLGKKI